MKAHILATTTFAALLAGCATTNAAPPTVADTAAVTSDAASDAANAIPSGTGYFAADSTLPFLAPDFTKISEADYEPAFEQAMEIQKAEIEAIVISSRSEERRVGKECVSTCSSRWSTFH